MSFRALRILVLLLALLLVAGMTFWERWFVTQWQRPLEVAVYPINGDGSAEVQHHVDSLQQAQFQEIGKFLEKQYGRYSLKKMPEIRLTLKSPIKEIPQPPPAHRSILANIGWSLSLRHYAYRHSPFLASLGSIRMFVIYHAPEQGRALDHSLGLRKGLIGVVHAYATADQAAQNNIVIAHELLHTLGASDKYDSNLMPLHPEGFAEPGDNGPQYPQHIAEIMGGRIPLSPNQATMPESLEDCVIGYKTAYEINW